MTTIEQKERDLIASAEKFKQSNKNGAATFELIMAAWKAMRPDAGLLFDEVRDVLKRVLG